MPSPDKLSLYQLYDCDCPDCGGQIERLSISASEHDNLQKAFNKAARWVFKQKKSEIQPDDLNDQTVQPLLSGINSVLQDGLNRGIGHTVPFVMQSNLSENIYVFSGAKTYAELKELSEKLLDQNGNIKPFSKFWQDVQSIHPQYNQSYLEAEYIFATQSAQMASKWKEFEADGGRYNLRYITAGDNRVRDSHHLLHNITLPPSDPYWEEYFPPNGWRCRCDTVQVRKSKYPESDSQQSIQYGSEATNGKNNIFRFNPGKQQVVFPDNHPYMKKLSDKEYETLKKKANETYSIKTADDVVKVVNEISKDKNWFERGFNKLEVTRKAGVNGATDMNGKIWLTKERTDHTISAINKLQKGEKLGASEADAISTFWHEVTHNRSKLGNMRMTDLQTKYMELANEFVSRKTLPEFYEAFGSKVQYPQLMQHRKTTGYNRMVRNYQKIIDKTGLENDNVVEKVKNYLFNEKYNDQETGLKEALLGAVKKDGTKLTKSEISHLVKESAKQREDVFEAYIDKYID